MQFRVDNLEKMFDENVQMHSRWESMQVQSTGHQEKFQYLDWLLEATAKQIEERLPKLGDEFSESESKRESMHEERMKFKEKLAGVPWEGKTTEKKTEKATEKERLDAIIAKLAQQRTGKLMPSRCGFTQMVPSVNHCVSSILS